MSSSSCYGYSLLILHLRSRHKSFIFPIIWIAATVNFHEVVVFINMQQMNKVLERLNEVKEKYEDENLDTGAIE